MKRERYLEAIPHYERLLALRPDAAEIHAAYGKLLWKSGPPDEAIATFRRAIELNPAYAGVRADLANALTEAGFVDLAAAELTRAIELDPRRADFYRFLVEVRPSAVTPKQVAALESMLLDESLTDDNRIEANFALGKTYESADRARSIAHLLGANETKRRYITYDERDTAPNRFNASPRPLAPHFSTRDADVPFESALPILRLRNAALGDDADRTDPRQPSARIFRRRRTDAISKTQRTPSLAAAGPIRPDAMLAASCDRLREIAERYVESRYVGSGTGGYRAA